MKNIVGVFRPFDRYQNFYIFENGNQIDTQKSTVDEINQTIFNLCEKYNIEQVDFTGPIQYIRGLKKKFELEEIKKYNKKKITINIHG